MAQQLISLTTQKPAEAPPTVTHYQEISGEVMAALDQLAGIIPKVDEAEASGRKTASVRLSVPETFISAVIDALEQLPELAASKKLDPVAGRDLLQFIQAFRPLYDKLFATTNRLGYTLRYAKDTLGSGSLQVLRIARQHASDGRSPLMAAHVENMQGYLARRGGLTKAERDQRKADALKRAVEDELKKRQIQEALAQAQQPKKEVKAAA